MTVGLIEHKIYNPFAVNAIYKENSRGNDQWYIYCDFCGREVPSRKGFEFNFNLNGCSGGYRAGLCHHCASEVRPYLLKMEKEMEKLRNAHTDERAAELEKRWNSYKYEDVFDEGEEYDLER